MSISTIENPAAQDYVKLYCNNMSCVGMQCQNMIIQSQTINGNATVNGDFQVNDTLQNTSVANVLVSSTLSNPVPTLSSQGIALAVSYPLAGQQYKSEFFVGDSSNQGGPSRFAVMRWENDSSIPSVAAATALASYSDDNNGQFVITANDNNNNYGQVLLNPMDVQLMSLAGGNSSSLNLTPTQLQSTANQIQLSSLVLPINLTGYGSNARPIGASSYDILVVSSSGDIKTTPGSVGGGSYSPILNNFINLAAASTLNAIFTQCGNWVQVDLVLSVTPFSGVLPLGLHVSLPVPRNNFSDSVSAIGQSTFGDPAAASVIGGTVASVNTQQTVLISVSSPGTTLATNLIASFTYLIQ